MAKLNIFVSSTCYDLAQIRKDLHEAIAALGHNPVMCENSSFPINPSETNFRNCLRIVEEEADFFVLIIGNRYGWQNENTGKSITNHEFLKAVEKGIPIYTFTLQQMVYVYDVWKDNPDANFSSIVDNNRIFEFIKDVRYKSNKWNYEFNNAQDIIRILKEQLSVLFKNALSYQRKVDGNKYAHLRHLVPNEAFDLLVDCPEGYEMKFMQHCMKESIDSYKNLRYDYDYAIYSKTESTIDNCNDCIEYANMVLANMSKTIDSVNNLFHQAFPNFYGEPGVPSDIEGLYYIGKTYGKLYASLLNLSIECRSLIVKDLYKPTIMALSKLPAEAIDQMEKYPQKSLEQIAIAEQNIKENEQKTIELILTVSISEEANNELSEELEKLKQYIM